MTEHELTSALLAGARTLDWNQQAATQLLIEHGYWLNRSVIRDRLWREDPPIAPEPMAVVKWRLVTELLDAGEVRASSSELAILRLACSLAGAHEEWGLAAMLRPLGNSNARLVADAVRHAALGPT